MKQKSWISIVFSFASQCRGKIALSVLCAIISVVAGLIPYWSVYQIITLFIGGSPVMAEVWKWCWIGLGAYAIRFLLYGISTSLSHISAYTILENIRLTLAQRLMKAPLGTVIGESVGKLKSVLVDRVETIELPLAHMIPECISNLLLPVAVFVYLVCIDWRMALATIENNIRFGNPSATQEEIIEAAKKARCHDFIMALPDGYETVIGEGGSTLSGGEKQRISIARAILKNANIVILDEATASIDPENEHLIQQAISELTIGKTVIVIAHRLATIEHADQILVVDKGQVVQNGTHQELVHQEGLYRRFITIREQAEGWSIV